MGRDAWSNGITAAYCPRPQEVSQSENWMSFDPFPLVDRAGTPSFHNQWNRGSWFG